MKKYEDIADSILEKYNAKAEKHRRRKIVMRRTACAGAGLCAAAVVGVFAWSPDITSKNRLSANKSGYPGDGEVITATIVSTQPPEVKGEVTEAEKPAETTAPTVSEVHTTAVTTQPVTTTAVITTEAAAQIVTDTVAVNVTVPPAEAEIPANTVSLSEKVLTEDLTLGSRVIPAGSKAVTVNIEKNTGFTAMSFSFTGHAVQDLILDGDGRPLNSAANDEFGRPLTTTCRFLMKGSFVGSVNGDTVVFAGAAGDLYKDNGDIFTFYMKGSAPEITSFDYGFYESGAPAEQSDIYMIGDFDSDLEITPADAAESKRSFYRTGSINYAITLYAPEEYFPNIADVNAAYIWNRPEDMIKTPMDFDTGNELLAYWADKTVGNTYTGTSNIGKKYYK